MRDPGLTGVVLCGGVSSRMGRDKAQLRLDGVSLLSRAVSNLRSVAAPVLVASGCVEIPGYACVLDAAPARGPLAGIVAGLRSSPHQLCAIVAVDMPHADAALLRSMAMAWNGEDVVVTRDERGIQPLHAVYAQSALPALRDALESTDRSLRAALRVLNVRFIDAQRLGAQPGFADNLNTPADVTRWVGRLPRDGAPPH